MKANDQLSRLKRLLYKDNLPMSDGIFDVLKTDVERLLGAYFYMDGAVDLKIETDGCGNYLIKIDGKAKQIKEVKLL